MKLRLTNQMIKAAAAIPEEHLLRKTVAQRISYTDQDDSDVEFKMIEDLLQ